MSSLEKSLFILRPDGFEKRNEILAQISRDLKIITTVPFLFNVDFAKIWYARDINKPHFKALTEYLLEGPSEFGIVEGNNAINKLLDITGRKTLPEECSQNSIRHKYSIGETQTQSGLIVLKNVIHRSKTIEQYKSETKLFADFIENTYNLILNLSENE
jgi:nucleoside diphosphate kinase